MRKRLLREIEVSAVGVGCMGFSHGYGAAPDRDESIRLIRHAFECGCTHFDTAKGYGSGHNETLLGEALKPVRHEVVIATKLRTEAATSDNTTENQVRAHLEASLKRLGTDHVELYYLHRVNPAVPVEGIAEVMGKLIRDGTILGWGQSRTNADQIPRAHAVVPLTAIQSEYSIMERVFEEEVLPLCRDSNISFVAFSPMAGGFLSGKVRAGDNMKATTFAASLPVSMTGTSKPTSHFWTCCTGLRMRRA
jgi:aryl-alcohol dehydrogenase-like predicted oxidoreductase